VKTLVLAATLLVASAALAGPTRSSPMAVAPDGHVFVVNPDSNTAARLEFDAMHMGTLTNEEHVGSCTPASTFDECYPRTLALGGTYVYIANQNDDSVSRLDQADLGNLKTVGEDVLHAGCNPYGVAATPAGDRVLVSCQGTSELLIFDTNLGLLNRVTLSYPNARAIAVSSDGSTAYVTHYLTEEPTSDAHVSKVELANASVSTVFAIPADTTTCETQNSGQGPLNEVSAIALMPDGAPSTVAGQLWVGGEQENNLTKGMFRREPTLANQPGASMFPFPYTPFPNKDAFNRNIMKPSFHDIIRFGIYKLSAADGHIIGKIDVDEGTQASDIQFSPDGTAAYIVDQGFNSYHVMPTIKGQGEMVNGKTDVTTIFAAPSAYGPGGGDPTHACVPEALQSVTSERPFRIAPEAQIVTIDGIDPADLNGMQVNTGVDFDTATYMTIGTSRMRQVPDGIGTEPMGVGLAPDGKTVYVANYLSRNVIQVGSATATDNANLRCSNSPGLSQTCGTSNDCVGGGGFCNHPGGPACNVDADCSTPPCVQNAQCVPIILGPPVWTITGDLTMDPTVDPLPPALLDGKILFDTAARDASVSNGVGLDHAAPPFDYAPLTCVNAPAVACTSTQDDCAACSNDASHRCTSDSDCPGATCVRPPGSEPKLCTNSPTTFCTNDADCGGGVATCVTACRVSTAVPGSVVSTSHDASYVTCQSCHSDFGGQDGRTWDFSQLGVSLRNTMDLRGRPGFAPGHCDNNASQQCTFDAACGDGHFCRADDANVPPNVTGADRTRYFNPMLTVHWNGDRDEVEDFEHTFRSLMGAGDCDAAEDTATCQGALIQRSTLSSTDPVDVNGDECAPNRNLVGASGKIVGIRLTHMADFVYSLTQFVKNPNQPNDTTERGRQIFNAQQTQCTTCHVGGPAGKQYFTDKKPLQQLDNPASCGGPDQNNPFLRHNVGTANLFDQTDPFTIALRDSNFPNPRIPQPGHRGKLADYVTPMLVDLWNTPPYLHDGSAYALLDVIRPCDATLDDCLQPGRGRNIGGQHGVTAILTPHQLNDLVAFQRTLSTATVVGGTQTQINVGQLTLSHVVLQFPRGKHGHAPRPGARGRVVAQGLLGADANVDPTAGVAVSLATPAGETMAVLDANLAMKGRGRLSGRASLAGGTLKLVLTHRSGGFRFTLTGKHLDLSTLDTGNRDLTVAMVISETNFVQNRNLAGTKNVFKLPKKPKKAKKAKA
jgi:DNA-binding beta-propeller fold protein YncE